VERVPPQRALFDVLPTLRSHVSWVKLGEFPTPVSVLPRALGVSNGLAFVKRDDQSSPVYGGNKVRTLELLFGAALDTGARTVVATGAYGSNHAVATALHAERVGLRAGAILFPQPKSIAALENLRVLLANADYVKALPHWSLLPFSMWATRYSRKLGPNSVMAPGGATPLGALGYVSAALELGQQIELGQLPAPSQIIVGLGSTCTSAGLLVGLTLAARFGIGFKRGRPQLVSVRVTPWPITSPLRIVRLAHRTSRLLANLAQDPTLALSWRQLRSGLRVDPGFLGEGYGVVTEAGQRASAAFVELGFPALDTTYSAKSGASFLARCKNTREPILFWSTKSSAPLPNVQASSLSSAPPRMLRWIHEAEGLLLSGK
jgi:D-cysteine desulfhydrase